MKKYMKLLLIFLILLITAPAWAQQAPELARLSPAVVGMGVPAAAGVTYDHIIACDDNAASTVVVNTGTAGYNWVTNASRTTAADLHDGTVYKEGTGSFNFALDTYNFIGSGASNPWTSEHFEITFWIYGDASGHQSLCEVGDGESLDSANEPNEWIVKLNGTTITIYVGDSDTVGNKSGTLNMTANQWLSVRVTYDGDDQSLVVEDSDDEVTWNSITLGAWAGTAPANGDTTLNSPFYCGSSTNNGYTGIRMDYIRIRAL